MTDPKFDNHGVATRAIAIRLAGLRRQLRRWIVVQGLGRWLWLLLATLALDMVLDRFFRMDFAQRLIVLALISVVAGAWIVWRVLRPLFNQVSDDALLLQVESRHAELQQRAISGFQLARQSGFEDRGVSDQLAQATISEGMSQASRLDFSDVLDRVRGRQNWALFLSGLVALAGLGIGISQSDFLQTWFRRNLLLRGDQWPRATNLEIVGVVDGAITLARGSDHRQVVRVTPDSYVQQIAVTLEIDASNGRTAHAMKVTGRDEGREHAFVFQSVGSEFRFRAAGGDALTDWVNVRLVEPPAITDLKLESILPAYTGRGRETLDGAGPHSVLVGSQILVTMASNKPLQNCRLRLGEAVFELSALDRLRQQFQIQLPGTETEMGVAGGKYEFRLVDETGLANLREFSFALKTRDDAPPIVRANLLGISGLVVPRALIPTSYSATDEYGLTSLDFDCHWTPEAEVVTPNSMVVPIWSSQEGEPIEEKQDVAVLPLEPMRLVPGTSFRFVLRARDNQPNGVGLGQSREFLLRVVTEEELLADLLRREIDQRKAFQAAYDAQMELISQTRQLAALPVANQSSEQRQAERQTEILGIHRGQRAVGTTVDAIAKRFEEFLVEVQNNRLDEETKKIDPQRTIEARFDGAIIRPLKQLDQELVSAASRNLDNCRRGLSDEKALRKAVEETAAIQESILDRMRQILSAMEDSENYQEVVNKLLEIKRSEERMKQQLKQQGNPEKIFDEPAKKGVFDDDK